MPSKFLLMKDFSELLLEKVETITQEWVDAVVRDRQITSTDHLSPQAVRNHISDVLDALGTVLSQTQQSDIETIAQASFHHGALRAEQDFDPTEVVREYHLLRSIILAHLHTEFLQANSEEILRAVSLINTVVDAAIAHCFKSYVNRRLQELEQVQAQLSLTIEELKRLVNFNQDNLSLLAHELKTPLTSIIGYSELFLRQYRQSKVKDSVPSLEHLERVVKNGRLLLRLINDALELSRYEAGKMQLQLAQIDVHYLIHTVVEVMQPLADERGLQLLLNIEDAPLQVVTDPLRLQQILLNLVSNAIRYTETGSVIIECQTTGVNQWSISIMDTGIGISEEDQGKLFQPFVRATSTKKIHPTDSTGLGLSIVKRLVQLLQGQINVVSELSHGSKFTVILPQTVNQQDEQEVDIAPTTSTVSNEN